MADVKTVSVKINLGDQTFHVRVEPEEKDHYERVASFTDSSFRAVCSEVMTSGAQAWAMTAFQLASDLLTDSEDKGHAVGAIDNARIKRLLRRIEEVTANT